MDLCLNTNFKWSTEEIHFVTIWTTVVEGLGLLLCAEGFWLRNTRVSLEFRLLSHSTILMKRHELRRCLIVRVDDLSHQIGVRRSPFVP